VGKISGKQRDGLDLRLQRQADIARMDAAADASADSLVTARDVDLSVAERQAARAVHPLRRDACLDDHAPNTSHRQAYR
jgi:hypothetical protein